MKTAIILAAGSGTRAGGKLPKQLQTISGKPMFLHSVERFREVDPETEIILVINESYRDEFLRAIGGIKLTVTSGGASRLESVSHALRLVPDVPGHLVAVHDAARPLVDTTLIQRGWKTAEEYGAAVPCVPLSDSIRTLEADGSKAADRSRFVAVQTPQVFDAPMLKRAYAAIAGMTERERTVLTDDASVVESAGGAVRLYDGDTKNMKVTGPADREIAETIYRLTR